MLKKDCSACKMWLRNIARRNAALMLHRLIMRLGHVKLHCFKQLLKTITVHVETAGCHALYHTVGTNCKIITLNTVIYGTVPGKQRPGLVP